MRRLWSVIYRIHTRPRHNGNGTERIERVIWGCNVRGFQNFALSVLNIRTEANNASTQQRMIIPTIISRLIGPRVEHFHY